VQSETGVIDVTGTAGEAVKVGISVADIAAGMYAYSGILTALIARQSTGRGTAVEVSLFDALSEWMSAPDYFTHYGGVPPPRSGAHHATIAPYGPHATRDGTVYLGIQNGREWTRFCRDVLEQPALDEDDRFRTNPSRVAHRDELTTVIDSVFSRLGTDEVIARLERAGIANARLRSIGEFRDHPQRTPRWREIDSPAGPLRALVPPVDMAGVEPVMGPVPSLGEHTDAILEALGFGADRVAAWRREGVI
jgi:crotonobetainyl-CoA:carnitine CoA-transferase CaiB-like acyl-CoA transferase